MTTTTSTRAGRGAAGTAPRWYRAPLGTATATGEWSTSTTWGDATGRPPCCATSTVRPAPIPTTWSGTGAAGLGGGRPVIPTGRGATGRCFLRDPAGFRRRRTARVRSFAVRASVRTRRRSENNKEFRGRRHIVAVNFFSSCSFQRSEGVSRYFIFFI